MSEELLTCPGCGATNRVSLPLKGSQARCGRCGVVIVWLNQDHVSPGKSSRFRPLEAVALVSLGVLLIGGIIWLPGALEQHPEGLIQIEQTQLEELEQKLTGERGRKEENLRQKLEEIDSAALRAAANRAYQSEFAARKNFDGRFALSRREQTQLRMQNLALTTAIPLKDRIRGIAREAAPEGSKVELVQERDSLTLVIEFDMASMVAGENTPRTRHQTIDSLKSEIRSLVSRVTNDVFLICKEFPVEQMQIGCVRSVWQQLPNDHRFEDKMLLYKVQISRGAGMDLTANPFLDSYATERRLRVMEDHFDSIQLITERR